MALRVFDGLDMALRVDGLFCCSEPSRRSLSINSFVGGARRSSIGLDFCRGSSIGFGLEFCRVRRW